MKGKGEKLLIWGREVVGFFGFFFQNSNLNYLLDFGRVCDEYFDAVDADLFEVDLEGDVPERTLHLHQFLPDTDSLLKHTQ